MRSHPGKSLLVAAFACLSFVASPVASWAAERVFIGGTWYPVTTSPDHLLVTTAAGVDAAALNDGLKRAGLDTALSKVQKAPQHARALLTFEHHRKLALPGLTRFEGVPELTHAAYAPLVNGSPLFLSGELLAKLAPQAGLEEARALLAHYGLTIKKAGFLFADRLLISNPDPTRSDIDLANLLMAYPKVFSWVECNLIRDMRPRYAPNDPYYKYQWHLNNTGSWFGQSGGTAGADIDAERAWDVTRGSASVIIAVIDDGVEKKHPDLMGKYVTGKDFVANDDDPTPPAGSSSQEGAPWGHGTCVAGTATAIGNNGIGVSGSCPDCGLIGVRLLSDEGTATSTIAEAFQWVCDQGAAVINNSWGPGDEASDYLDYGTQGGIDYCVQHGRNGLGTVFVWAAGNEKRLLKAGQVEAYPEILTIGASEPNDTYTSYSNYGPYLAVVAPAGGDVSYSVSDDWWIVTTDVTGTNGYSSRGRSALGYGTEIDSTGNYTKYFNGTSAASPVAAGVVGLVISANPNLTYSQVMDTIRKSADKTPQASLYNSNGFNQHYGYGRVNAYNAVRLAQSGDCGALNAQGTCYGSTAQWCDNGKLASESCDTSKGIFCQKNDQNLYRCVQCTPSAKSCTDKRDNDCDGNTDEQDECQDNECVVGSRLTCQGLIRRSCGTDGQIDTQNCDDENPCTNDACATIAGCSHTNVADGTSCGDGGTCTKGTCSVKIPVDGDADTTPTDGDKTDVSDSDSEKAACSGECLPTDPPTCTPDGLCQCIGLSWMIKDCLFVCITQGKSEGSCGYDPLNDTMACKCTASPQADGDADYDLDIPTPQKATGGGGCSQNAGGLAGLLGFLLLGLGALRRRA